MLAILSNCASKLLNCCFRWALARYSNQAFAVRGLGADETGSIPRPDPHLATFNGPSALPTRKPRRAASLSGWHTVVNDEKSYIETSVAAFMISAMSRAILHSWVEPEVYGRGVESAMAFLLEHVRPDGLLDGVSYGTSPSTCVEHSRRMPHGGMAPWGQGPLLAALWWYSRLRSAAKPHGENLWGGSTACASTTKSPS